jgi:hypothetical protein
MPEPSARTVLAALVTIVAAGAWLGPRLSPATAPHRPGAGSPDEEGPPVSVHANLDPRPGVGMIPVRPSLGLHCGCAEPPEIAVLIDDDVIHVGVSRLAIDRWRIERNGREWELLATLLAEFKAEDTFAERDDIQIAGGGWSGAPVTLAELVRGFDAARAAGFFHIAFLPADGLAMLPAGHPWAGWWRWTDGSLLLHRCYPDLAG